MEASGGAASFARRAPGAALGLFIAALLIALLATQALADASAPPAGRAPTGRSLGRAGFAYLTGIRTFAAAALWSRIEPIEHGYYEGRSLRQQVWAVPTGSLVVALDPQFVQAYYVMPWILYRRGETSTAMGLALEGVRNNPRSGLMHAAYGGMLASITRDIPAALAQARLALASDWVDVQDKFDGYTNIRLIFEKAGDMRAREVVQAEVKRLQKLPLDQPIKNGKP
jgi:hypothetical protein